MRALAILITVATIYSGMHDAVLAQTSTPNVTAPFQGLQTPLTSTTTNCMMLQLAGGELSNKLCSSLTAHDRRNLERDCEHGVRVGLHFEPARVSVQLRAGCSFTIGKSAGLKRRAFTIIRPPGCRPGSARLPW